MVTGVEVETKKAKRYDDDEVGMDQGRDKERREKTRIFFNLKKIRGPTRFEVSTATVPRQRRQKACWVF